MNHLVKKLKMYGLKKFVLYSLSEVYLILWMQTARNSYSQKGEDVEIDRLLGNKRHGFYVDVGANDPVRFNNTYRFYKRGWRGINIEPDIESYEKIKRMRKRDVNLNFGVGSRAGRLKLYRFIPHTLTTFSKEEADRCVGEGYVLKGVQEVEVKKLALVLENYLRRTKIDFMSVDTEGFDLEVLKGNNWRRFRPRVLCVESTPGIRLKNGEEQREVGEFLVRHKYKLFLDNGINSIYVDSGSAK